jgi:hypothetical protein
LTSCAPRTVSQPLFSTFVVCGFQKPVGSRSWPALVTCGVRRSPSAGHDRARDTTSIKRSHYVSDLSAPYAPTRLVGCRESCHHRNRRRLPSPRPPTIGRSNDPDPTPSPWRSPVHPPPASGPHPLTSRRRRSRTPPSPPRPPPPRPSPTPPSRTVSERSQSAPHRRPSSTANCDGPLKSATEGRVRAYSARRPTWSPWPSCLAALPRSAGPAPYAASGRGVAPANSDVDNLVASR